MKPPHSYSKIIILAILLALFLISLTSQDVLVLTQAQTSCQPVHRSGFHWPQGVTVTVYIDPAYNAQEVEAIKRAFTNWENLRLVANHH